MKTILVPLDLTAASEHALAYANKLAVRWPAEVVVLYCHHGPELAPAETAGLHQRLQALVERLRYQQLVRQEARRIRYQYRVLMGCLHDHIEGVVARHGVDLVVMGLEHSDCGRPAVAGNHAVRLAGLVACPVLVVPPGRRSLPSRLVFAAEFDRLSLHTLPRLSGLAEALPGHLQLVQLYAPQQRSELARLKRSVQAARAQLTWPSLEVALVEDDDPLEGLSDYCARTQAQLLILAPANDQLLRRFFDACYATTHAYHQQIPVLVLRQPAPVPATLCCARCAERQHAEAQGRLPVDVTELLSR
jgi:nucleotide-binding universal stress UspA family protein